MNVASPVIGRTRSFVFLCIAVTYGLVLSQLPDADFLDFKNYLVYAEHSLLIALRYVDGGVLRVLVNEPVWLIVNIALGSFLDSETVIRTIIFFSATGFAWLILRHYPQHFIWLILFCFLPQVIKNYLIQLRQGVAISVFLWGWLTVNRPLRWLLLVLTPFIHSSFFFILALLGLTWILRSIRFAPDLKILTYGFVGIILGLVSTAVAKFAGARQADLYIASETAVSGLGFFLWVTILGIMLSAGKTWLREHTFESGAVAFYLLNYWLVQANLFARVFESCLIFVLLAGLTLRGWRRRAFLGTVLGAGLIAWVLRIGQPALGFGVLV
jgi:hypothetical protein